MQLAKTKFIPHKEMATHRANKPKKDSFFNLYFTSTISISIALFMVGFVALLLFWGRSVANSTKENLIVSIVLSDSTTGTDINRVQAYLKATDFVKEQTYISKEQALKEHIEDLGENPVELAGYNPLKASIEINLNAEFINDKFLGEIKDKFKNYSFIDDIVFQQTMISDLTENIHKISIILLIVSTILVLITIVIINNTIRISIYSKRFLINTMKLVGAKAWFIRRPFIWRFIQNGLIASVLACGGLFGFGYYIKTIDSTLPLYDYKFYLPIVLIVFLLGFLVNFFASLFAINKYIRMKSDDLYFI